MIDIETLRRMLDYDPETGVFTWRDCQMAYLNGKRAGGPTRVGRNIGYWRIRISPRLYAMHRLAWFYVYAEWPKHTIDHIDGNRGNNAIANLRDVPHGINMQNAKTQRRNPTGFRGVSKTKRGFSSSICFKRRTYHLGVFQTPQEAHAAYLAASQNFHGENHGQ